MNSAQEITDEDIRAAFSLLPKVLNLLKHLSNVQSGDAPKQTQLIQATIEELKLQLQRCRQVLEYCPYLDQTPEQQKALLVQKQERLKHTCDLLVRYKEMDVLTQSTAVHR